MKPLAKNVPAKSEWLFGDNLNKRINTISSTSTALTACICPYYQYDKYQGSKTGSNQQHYGSKNSQTSRRGSAQGKRWPQSRAPVPQKLDNVNSKNIVHSSFAAGNIEHFYKNWKKITNDHIILSIFQYGFKINFKEKPQYQNVPKILHGMLETEIITQEVKNFSNKGVIVECSRETCDFVSTVFTWQKKDGTFRTILNLKYLNEFVQYQHCKMESLLDVFKIIKPNAWMASIDLKDAFFTVPINESHQEYFKFQWIDKYIRMGILLARKYLQRFLNLLMRI